MNWKKLLEFRNMQEKLEKNIFLHFNPISESYSGLQKEA